MVAVRVISDNGDNDDDSSYSNGIDNHVSVTADVDV